jgi:hypothetical protein
MKLEIAQPLLPQPDLIFDGLPFTRAEGRSNDLDAKQVRRLLRLGLLRAVVRGVYVDSLVEDSLPLRAAAAAKVAPPDSARPAGHLASRDRRPPRASSSPPLRPVRVGRDGSG